MNLYCVRHGETVYNATGRVQGQNECPLSALGQRQAQLAARYLSMLPIEAIVASPLRRAADSARIIADALQLEIEFDERLKELHAGVFQESLWSELEQRFPAEWGQWRSHDADYRIPGGESRRDLMTRSHAAFRAIRERGYRSVLVVAHGGSLIAAFKALLEIPAHRSPFALSNASISVAVWEKEFRLLSVNETGHLSELSADVPEL